MIITIIIDFNILYTILI